MKPNKPARTSTLTKRASRALRKERLRRRRMNTLALAVFPISLGVLLPLALFPVTQSVAFSVLLSLSLFYLCAVYYVQRDRRKIEKFKANYKQSILALTERGGISAIPILTGAMWNIDPEIAGAVPPALIRLLPRLQAENAELLPPEQRANLHRLLLHASEPNIELKLAALSALIQCGDEKTLRVLQSLLANKGFRPQDPLLLEAVREQEPLLAARLEQERVNAVMLRPASAPDDAPQTLLRPAYGAEESEPQQLLRASNGSDAP